jgi:hypothetical protein
MFRDATARAMCEFFSSFKNFVFFLAMNRKSWLTCGVTPAKKLLLF